jgi:hypothetical protein
MAAAHLPTLRPAASISRTSEAAATAEAMRWEKAVAPVEDHAGARSRQPQLALPPNPALLLLLPPNPVLGPPIDRTRGGEEGEHERAEAKKAARAGRPRRLAGDTADLLLFCKVQVSRESACLILLIQLSICLGAQQKTSIFPFFSGR